LCWLSSTAIEPGINTAAAPDPPGPAVSPDPTAIAELANPPPTAPTRAPAGGGVDDVSFPAISPGIDTLFPGITGAFKFPFPKDNVPGADNTDKFPSPPVLFPPDPGGGGNMLGGTAGNGADNVCCCIGLGPIPSPGGGMLMPCAAATAAPASQTIAM